jgi:hypothetical protein
MIFTSSSGSYSEKVIEVDHTHIARDRNWDVKPSHCSEMTCFDWFALPFGHLGLTVFSLIDEGPYPFDSTLKVGRIFIIHLYNY